MSLPNDPLSDVPRTRLERARARLATNVGHGLPISIGLILAGSIVAGVLAFVFLNSAPPTTLTMASGPPGSAFRLVAEQYRKILAREASPSSSRRLRARATTCRRSPSARPMSGSWWAARAWAPTRRGGCRWAARPTSR